MAWPYCNCAKRPEGSFCTSPITNSKKSKYPLRSRGYLPTTSQKKNRKKKKIGKKNHEKPFWQTRIVMVENGPKGRFAPSPITKLKKINTPCGAGGACQEHPWKKNCKKKKSYEKITKNPSGRPILRWCKTARKGRFAPSPKTRLKK